MRRTSHPSFVFLLMHLFVSDQKNKNKNKNGNTSIVKVSLNMR